MRIYIYIHICVHNTQKASDWVTCMDVKDKKATEEASEKGDSNSGVRMKHEAEESVVLADDFEHDIRSCMNVYVGACIYLVVIRRERDFDRQFRA
jgi:hypothetical protein